MIPCTNCKAKDGRPVFRTNPLGETPAGWMCRPCILIHHDASLIDEETQEIADILTSHAPPAPAPKANAWHAGLTEQEREELVGLEYVLTHYPKHPEADEKRYKFLSEKNWAARDAQACVFCGIVNSGKGVLRDYPHAVVFEPLNPVVKGHLLVVPKCHVADASADASITAATMAVAAQELALLGRPANLITSIGKEATQSVFHLHVHIVPRVAGDGLALPWTGQAIATPPTIKETSPAQNS